MENVVNKITYSEKNEPLNSFYPEIQPYKTEFLKVSDIHNLYVEQSGNPKGRPCHLSSTAAQVAEQILIIVVFLIPTTIELFYLINVAQANQHPLQNSKKTQRGILSVILKKSELILEFLIGLFLAAAGDRHWLWLMPKLILKKSKV
jgi:hypothetical protein